MKHRAHKLKSNYSNYLLPVISALLLLILLGIAIRRLLREERIINDQIIVEHVAQLSAIFKKIDQRCRITDFDHNKNYIDFLNVKSFVGSGVGAMDLAFPDQWEGPYLQENPTIQGKKYMIVKTKKGYFIVPGDGVKLANGKTMGHDIVIHNDTNIEALTHDPHGLSYEGQALAAPVNMSQKILGLAVADQMINLDAAHPVQHDEQVA